ncbi:MAG: TonB-dependent receptor [Neisseriaceae bacterium]|nr:TonB-dependent receptor [Neisseriaceae bacterium]
MMNKLVYISLMGISLLPHTLLADGQVSSEPTDRALTPAETAAQETATHVTAQQPEKSLASSVQEGQLTISTDNHYYNWKGDNGRHGWQYVMPWNVSYQYGAFNAGLRNAYIYSQNNSSDEKGTAKGFSDTSVSFAYTAFQQKSFPVRFNLSMNIPTGKDSLAGDEKNAIMDGNLVWQTRLGEGFNITPAINIAHSFTNKDTVGLGVSRIFRGEFDPNRDVDNDVLHPGDDTIVTLQYSHTDQRYQVQTGLSYQHSGITKRDRAPYYQKGDLWTADISGQFAVTPNQTVYGGYSYSYRKKDKYINNFTGNLEIEEFNSNGKIHWLNAGYSVAFKQRHSVGVVADYLKITSNGYDQINALYLPARTKVGFGMNYNYRISPNASLSLSAKRFLMKDKETPNLGEQHYRGWNLFGSLKYQF